MSLKGYGDGVMDIEWKRSADGLTIQIPKTLSDQLVIGFKLVVK